ncbi:Oidioi.mRNA.OKI2018_I69.PAR.g13027.t1.cds [Oikopleura dioica]|uniref:Oidioi.mRNA.OKI2018_I69.PAR.g13027.t1.cds n=1 Tax=Oikopleura dioica TaxID=34765 RepID=A0ABN7S6Q4_OIKDI|nr:Oidioi.mRNA.OKI2018_I69.PAR.g13027.t1.cds [Oikopleura dioica]
MTARELLLDRDNVVNFSRNSSQYGSGSRIYNGTFGASSYSSSRNDHDAAKNTQYFQEQQRKNKRRTEQWHRANAQAERLAMQEREQRREWHLFDQQRRRQHSQQPEPHFHPTRPVQTQPTSRQQQQQQRSREQCAPPPSYAQVSRDPDDDENQGRREPLRRKRSLRELVFGKSPKKKSPSSGANVQTTQLPMGDIVIDSGDANNNEPSPPNYDFTEKGSLTSIAEEEEPLTEEEQAAKWLDTNYSALPATSGSSSSSDSDDEIDPSTLIELKKLNPKVEVSSISEKPVAPASVVQTNPQLSHLVRKGSIRRKQPCPAHPLATHSVDSSSFQSKAVKEEPSVADEEIDPAVGPTKKPPKSTVYAEEDGDSPTFVQAVGSLRKKYELMKLVNKDLKIQDVNFQYEPGPMSPMSKIFQERPVQETRIWGPPGRNAASAPRKDQPEKKGALDTTGKHDCPSSAKETSFIPVSLTKEEGNESMSLAEQKIDLDESAASFHSAISMPYDSPVEIMKSFKSYDRFGKSSDNSNHSDDIKIVDEVEIKVEVPKEHPKIENDEDLPRAPASEPASVDDDVDSEEYSDDDVFESIPQDRHVVVTTTTSSVSSYASSLLSQSTVTTTTSGSSVSSGQSGSTSSSGYQSSDPAPKGDTVDVENELIDGKKSKRVNKSAPTSKTTKKKNTAEAEEERPRRYPKRSCRKTDRFSYNHGDLF